MTKTVFDNAMTTHVWAAQSQPEGRSSNGNLYFEGPTLFSYGRHYVAGLVLHIPGRRVFLTNADSYSISTSRHVSYADRAAHYGAISCAGLTAWEELLKEAGLVYDWHKAEEEEATGNRAPWLPCGFVERPAADRRKRLPRLRAMLKEAGDRSPGRQFRNQFDWPGEEAAAAMLEYCGDKNPAKSAATAKAANDARVAKRKAREDREKRDNVAAYAKRAAAMSRGDLARKIAESLGRYSHAETAIQQLAEEGRELNRAAKEAKARGWTRVAGTCRDHYKAIRAAVKDGEERQAAAYRNANRRRAINRFREAVTLWNRDFAGGFDAARGADGGETWVRAQLLSRRAGEVAGAARDLAANGVFSDRLAAVKEAAELKAAELKEEAARLRYEEQAANIAAWRAGDMAGRFRFDCPRGGAALRALDVERDDSGQIVGGTLQTSHGADVPLAHAIRAFRFLKHCRDTGTAWAANGRQLRVGHFRVDRVESNGDFRAGCHFITWQEVESLAVALGVFDMPAAEEEREYQTAWRAGSDWSEAREEAAEARAAALALLAERRAAKARAGDNLPAICRAIRDSVSGHVRTIREARDRMAELAAGDADSLWFYPGEERLRGAFCEGAGLDTFPGQSS